MDLNSLEPIHVFAVYTSIEVLKWFGNKVVSEKEQFKILHSISKSQEAVAQSFSHVATILEKILIRMGGRNHDKGD